MNVKDWLPENILGMCIPKEKRIIINSERPNVVEDPKEFERLVRLAEDAYVSTRVFSGKSVQEDMKKRGEINSGSAKRPSYGYTQPHYFAGVIGGLEIYYGSLCSGERILDIWDNGDIVFRYKAYDFDPLTYKYIDSWEDLEKKIQEGAIRITHYVPGKWERKLKDWAKTAKKVWNSELVLAPFWS